jgi:hypothetical protein
VELHLHSELKEKRKGRVGWPDEQFCRIGRTDGASDLTLHN